VSKDVANFDMREDLPEGYTLIKDMVLDIWWPLHDGFFINRIGDKPFQFESKQEAIRLCWLDILARQHLPETQSHP
jgi:hypothetical protein